ncbi:MAG: hypothetical protein Q9205_000646 [Flavoplaca limonia]
MSSERKESIVEGATLKFRQELTGASGPRALVRLSGRVSPIMGKCFGLIIDTIGSFIYGYNQTMTSFEGRMEAISFDSLARPLADRIVDMGDWISNSTRKGWLTAIFELVAWLACLYSGFLAEMLSRKYAIPVNVAIFVVGVGVQSSAAVAGYLIRQAERTPSQGLAIGAISVNVPNHNAEVAPPEVRGSLVALQQLTITAGIMISFWIDNATHYIGGTGGGQSDAAWLIPICLQLIQAQDDSLIELGCLEIKAKSVFEKRNAAEKWPHLVDMTPMDTFKLQFVAVGSLFTTKAMFGRVITATVTSSFNTTGPSSPYGLMTAGEALFLWFYVPEPKRLALEETDVVSRSVGVARADSARMQEIHLEIGLDDALRHMGIRTGSERSDIQGDVCFAQRGEGRDWGQGLVGLLMFSG